MEQVLQINTSTFIEWFNGNNLSKLNENSVAQVISFAYASNTFS